ncbi:MAG TPA: Nramp family divalent metal transporter [Micropepsaceae bacterium]|nr:Nramp family divalent metal transporter [Micropepsaceae bacterium]
MVPPPATTSADTVHYAGDSSVRELIRSVAVPSGTGQLWRKLLAFSGPGCLVAVGYMDPGNWATDIAGGSQFGYAILPVIVLSNFVAIFLQYLALKLGIASGCDLAQACRRHYRKPATIVLWAAAEIAIVACDLAEVIGTAVALQLLFRIPLLIGTGLTIVDTLFVMTLMNFGMRRMEAFITSLFALIAGCFVIELLMAKPDMTAMTMSFAESGRIAVNPDMLYIALGIFGATVMPHNLYLHSSLVQSRRFALTQESRREAVFFGTVDSTTALMLALFVNAAILILAAAAFHGNGLTNVIDITQAHRLLTPLLGTVAGGILFAVALLASGQNSTITGTLAGQIVMEGMLELKISRTLRRFLTRALAIVPVFAVVAVAGDGAITRLLIFSQVVLSLQLTFAIVPLVMFTSDRKIMGAFVNSVPVRGAGFFLAALVVAANVWLVLQTLMG